MEQCQQFKVISDSVAARNTWPTQVDLICEVLQLSRSRVEDYLTQGDLRNDCQAKCCRDRYNKVDILSAGDDRVTGGYALEPEERHREQCCAESAK